MGFKILNNIYLYGFGYMIFGMWWVFCVGLWKVWKNSINFVYRRKFVLSYFVIGEFFFDFVEIMNFISVIILVFVRKEKFMRFLYIFDKCFLCEESFVVFVFKDLFWILVWIMYGVVKEMGIGGLIICCVRWWI